MVACRPGPGRLCILLIRSSRPLPALVSSRPQLCAPSCFRLFKTPLFFAALHAAPRPVTPTTTTMSQQCYNNVQLLPFPFSPVLSPLPLAPRRACSFPHGSACGDVQYDHPPQPHSRARERPEQGAGNRPKHANLHYVFQNAKRQSKRAFTFLLFLSFLSSSCRSSLFPFPPSSSQAAAGRRRRPAPDCRPDSVRRPAATRTRAREKKHSVPSSVSPRRFSRCFARLWLFSSTARRRTPAAHSAIHCGCSAEDGALCLVPFLPLSPLSVSLSLSFQSLQQIAFFFSSFVSRSLRWPRLATSPAVSHIESL